MTNQNHLERIIKHGDFLERHMYKSENFANDFSIYPIIWNRYVLVNRKKGKLTLKNSYWQYFAERHYSAIVRCWNTMASHERIINICANSIDNNDAAAHLDILEALSSFFYFAGAAIENLQQAFAVKPLEKVDVFIGIKERMVDGGYNLKWFYERRSQCIHKVVVPVFINNGLLSVDTSFFDDTETHWDTARSYKKEDLEELSRFLWKHFVEQMNKAWSTLADELKSIQDEETPVFIDPPTHVQPTWTSGNADFPGGTPTLPSGVHD